MWLVKQYTPQVNKIANIHWLPISGKRHCAGDMDAYIYIIIHVVAILHHDFAVFQCPPLQQPLACHLLVSTIRDGVYMYIASCTQTSDLYKLTRGS